MDARFGSGLVHRVSTRHVDRACTGQVHRVPVARQVGADSLSEKTSLRKRKTFLATVYCGTVFFDFYNAHKKWTANKTKL